MNIIFGLVDNRVNIPSLLANLKTTYLEKIKKKFYVYVCLNGFMCPCACKMLRKSEGMGVADTGAIDDWEPPCGSWESHTNRSLAGTASALTAEPFLQH